MKIKIQPPGTKPDDALTIEVRPSAESPSFAVTISRHGVTEDCFTRAEVLAIAAEFESAAQLLP